jgi:hypothetical protein
MRTIRIAAALAGTLALAACYVTEKPIITAANAAYPFADGTTFTAWNWDEDTNAWEQSGSGKIVRNGERYRLVPNPEPGQEHDPEDEVVFLLADLGDGYFAGEASEKDGKILLDAIKVEGDTILQYVLMCEAEDKKFAEQGIIVRFEDGEFTDTCTVSSLDQLRRALRAKLAAGMKPRAKYVKTR